MHPASAEQVRRPLPLLSTVDAVAREVRTRILDGEFGPGDALREARLAAEYAVSRHTIRAALMTLSHEAFVVVERNHGAHVPTLTAADVSELYFVRGLIEPEVARIVSSRSDRNLSSVRSSVALMAAFNDGTPWHEVVRADVALHRAIVAAAGSPRLNRLYQSLVNQMELTLAQLRTHYRSPRDLAAEHQALVDALEAGNADQAAEAVRRHLYSGQRDLTGLIAAEGSSR
jgi:DNA-binding GntR family transcriptional regulator